MPEICSDLRWINGQLDAYNLMKAKEPSELQRPRWLLTRFS